MWLVVGKCLASEPGGERWTLADSASDTVGMLQPSSAEEDLLQCFERAFARRDGICFCFLEWLVGFGCLERGLLWGLIRFCCFCLPLETGAVKRHTCGSQPKQ